MSGIGRPINYYGSKDRLARRIIGLVPPGCDTWVDLFCGSAIVTLRKPRHRREVINDLNQDVVNLFAVLRDDEMARKLYRLIELTPYSEVELRLNREVCLLDPVEKAWQFLVEGWFSRGGDNHKTGFRWSKGQTTAPELSWAVLPARLSACANRLRGVCIRSVDALRLIDEYDVAGSVIFVDTPYPGRVGRRYRHSMSGDQHAKLAERLRQCKARVILTMNPGTVYSDVLSSWCCHDVAVYGNGHQTKPEIILTNYEAGTLFAFEGAA